MWPKLFEVTPLARLVFQFMPKVQVIRYVYDCNDQLQFQICSWMPKEYLEDVGIAIGRADNVLCWQYFQFATDMQTELLKFPMPNLLPKLLSCNKGFSDVDCKEVALCNLKILIEQDPQSQLQRLVQEIHHFGPLRNKECLLWMLYDAKLSGEIGMLLRDTVEDEVLDLIAPCVKSKQLTIEKASNFLLARLSPDVFVVVEPSLSSPNQLDMIWDCTIKNGNWPLAAYLWNPNRSVFLPFLFRFSPTSYEISWEHTFVSNLEWYNKPNMPSLVTTYEIRHLNSAIQFVHSDAVMPQEFKCIMRHILSRVLYLPEAELLHIFEYACIHGQFYIAHYIWQQALETRDCQIRKYHPKLRAQLAKSSFCRNVDMLEFAWVRATREIVVMHWIYAAYNNNNEVVWKFLHQKNVLAKHLDDTTGRGEKLVQSLGRKPVDMLEVIWDLSCVHTPENIHAICHHALYSLNIPLLKFFNDQKTQLCQDDILAVFFNACSADCTNIIAQLKDCSLLDQRLLANMYFHSTLSSETRRAMWSVAPLKDPLQALNYCASVPFDMCVLLLEKQILSAQQIMDVCKKYKNPELLNQLRAYMYCEVDEL